VRRIFRIALVLVLPVLALTGCGEAEKWRQKLTVTVTTPHGDVSGSSVSEVRLSFSEDALWATTGTAYSSSHRGEAVALEVQPGKYMFALLDNHIAPLALKVFVGDKAWGQPNKADRKQVQSARGAKSVKPKDYPMLVTFTDINDPKSVMQVKPGNIGEAFGSGYSLQSITLEIVDEAPTRGQIIKVLPWLDQYWARYLDGSSNPNPQMGLSNNIGGGNFGVEN
jgi:hypothetical protein